MTKPAKQHPPETTAALAGFRSATRDRVLGERIDEMEKRFSGEVRGLRAECNLLRAENAGLKIRIFALENDVRTPAARRNVMLSTVAACGNGGSDAG
jgi:hypothetical protein